MTTPIRIVERKLRILTLESRPDWMTLGGGILLLCLSASMWLWALANGLTQFPLAQTSPICILNTALTYLGLRMMMAPLGSEQVLLFNKNLNTLTVRTKGVLRNRDDRYKLSDVIKVHLNRVDDGTFDKDAMLLIFVGGGAIQFPSRSGNREDVERITNMVSRFLNVQRADGSPTTTLVARTNVLKPPRRKSVVKLLAAGPDESSLP